MDALVSTDWLERELGASDLRVVDATKFLGADRDARAEYEAGHIPGAVFMDLADLTDASNAVENLAPSAEKFARSEEHTSELQSLMRNSYAGFCLKKKTDTRYTLRAQTCSASHTARPPE